MGLDRIKHSFHESLLTENSTDMTEMETIAHNQSYMLQQHSQKPVIFSLLDLKSEPFWDGVLKDDILKLEKNYEIIMDEFNAIFYHGKASDGWAMNSTPTGTWSIFCFINQGSVIPQNAELCPKTWQIVQSLQNLMTDCVFGNVAFSVIYRGTKITEHYGPTNIRLRCHLALQAPSSGSLTVNGISKKWKEGKCLLFDDSFLHSVEYHKASSRTESTPDGHSVLSSQASPDLTAETGNQDECTGEENACIRSILMLDFWHPGLTDKERKALGYSFSTLGTCVES
ncbi:aspartate beta-hydroxylase domain-containing protein 2-like isoform X2 [Liolophura sinensis]